MGAGFGGLVTSCLKAINRYCTITDTTSQIEYTIFAVEKNKKAVLDTSNNPIKLGNPSTLNDLNKPTFTRLMS